MFRVIGIALFLMLTGLFPAVASDLQCNDASIVSVKAKLVGIRDDNAKKMAMDHIMMAQNSYSTGRIAECVKQIMAASRAMGDL